MVAHLYLCLSSESFASSKSIVTQQQDLEHLQYLIQRVVSSEEAEQLILQGRKFAGVLPNSKAIVEK